jgi:ribosomal protein L29
MGAVMSKQGAGYPADDRRMLTDEQNSATQWRELNVEELRSGVPALKTALAGLERAKAVSQETLKSEISV